MSKNFPELVVLEAHEQLDRGEAELALEALEAVLSGGNELAPVLWAEAMGLRGVALRALERDDEARDALDHAIGVLDQAPIPNARVARVIAGLLEDRAEIELSMRVHSKARQLLIRAVDLRQSWDEAIEAETWLALGDAAHGAGERDEALVSLERAEKAAREDDDLEALALSHEMRADIELEDPSGVNDAAGYYVSAENAWRTIEDREGVIRCLVGRARVAERCDDDTLVATLIGELDLIGAHSIARQLRDGDIG